MVLEGLLTILQSLFGWLFLLILQLLLKIVDIVESFFNVFAGTTEVYYYGKPVYLFNLFFTSTGVTNLFWAMVIIAVILSFGFCIVAVARKVTDISGTTKHTLGQIISNFIRSLVVILLLNICIIAALNVTAVIFDRINYSLDHAATLGDGVEKTYTDEEFATMARILATIGNYSANPSAESRYNVNSCFNAIRGEMLTLYNSDCFNYDFPIVQEGKHSWQSALAQVAKSANLKEDLQLDTYYSTVQDAIILCFEQLRTNPNFKPQETAIRQYESSKNMTTAQMIFLAASMGAEENEQFENGSFDDALRRSYINGEKSIYSYSDVFEDFSLRKINYIIGIIVACCMILFLGKVILLFIVRMFNLVLLYVISPLFASSMALDEGSRFQNWTQSFIMQLLAAYGGVVMMRIYLLILPTVLNSNLHFFEAHYFGNVYNIYGQLFIVLAGSWAVSKASNLVSGALTGNASGAFQEAESAIDRTISENLGSGMLKKEFDRWRMNRDRAKSYAKGRYDKSLRPKGADDGAKDLKDIKKMLEGNGNRNSRNNMPKDDSGRSYSSLDGMKHDFRLDGNVAPTFSKESGDALESSSLAKMRQDMGFESKNSAVFDGPVNGRAIETSGNFDVDSLPDLGAGLKGKGKSPTSNNTKGGPKTSKTVSNTGSTKRNNTITTPPITPTSKTVPTPPTSTGAQNKPLTGGGTTNTTSTGTQNKPLTGGGTTNTTSTGTQNTPLTGGRTTNPTSTGTQNTPLTGGGTTNPTSTGTQNAPQTGGRTTNPTSTGTQNAPLTGGGTTNPTSTGTQNTPQTGGGTTNPTSTGTLDNKQVGSRQTMTNTTTGSTQADGNKSQPTATTINSTVGAPPTNPTVSTVPNGGIGSVANTSLDSRQTGGVQPRTGTTVGTGGNKNQTTGTTTNSTVAPPPTNPTVSTAPNVGIESATTTSLDSRQTGGVQPRTDTATTTDNVVGTIPANGTVNTATSTLENRQVGGVQTNTNTNIASKLNSANGAATQTVQTQPLGGQTTGAAATTPIVRVRPSSSPTDNAKTREQLKSRLNASKNN